MKKPKKIKPLYFGILAIFAVAALAAAFTHYPNISPKQTTTSIATEKELECVNSGGIVMTSSCCKSVEDLPNTCVIGACGCSMQNSHPVKVCICRDKSCWDGTACIAQT